MAHAPASMNLTEHPERLTDHDGYLQPGCYYVFDSLEILASDPVNVSLALTYYRYNKAGKQSFDARAFTELRITRANGAFSWRRQFLRRPT